MKKLFSILALLIVMPAHADALSDSSKAWIRSWLGDGEVELRLLGPAASWHASKTDARTVATKTTVSDLGQHQVSVLSMNGAAVSNNPDFAKLATGPGAKFDYSCGAVKAGVPGTCSYSLLSSSIVRYADHSELVDNFAVQQTKTEPVKRWTDAHPGLGIELRTRDQDGDVHRVFAEVVTDSYDFVSLMLGGAWQHEFASTSDWRFDAGFMGGIWWRGINTNQRITRKLVPTLLPALSAEYKPWGVSADLLIAPRLKHGDNFVLGNTTTTVMLQLGVAL